MYVSRRPWTYLKLRNLLNLGTTYTFIFQIRKVWLLVKNATNFGLLCAIYTLHDQHSYALLRHIMDLLNLLIFFESLFIILGMSNEIAHQARCMGDRRINVCRWHLQGDFNLEDGSLLKLELLKHTV